MEILYGKPVAEAIARQLRQRIEALGRAPRLGVLQVGDAPGGVAYLHSVEKRGAALGVALSVTRMPGDCRTEEALAAVDRMNRDPELDGCLLLRPMPQGLDEDRVCQRLRAAKDVDGITNQSLGYIFTGEGQGHPPCTAEACLRLLDHYGVQLSGARVTVVGRSLVVGRPLSLMLTARDATVTLCHSRTRELSQRCREADILICAAGRAGLVRASWVNPDQVVLDVGTSLDEQGRLRGDVAFEEVSPLVRAITPVPGGIGAVTTAVLLEHVVRAAERGK